jgi:CheY-like chemotaxis protein
VGALRFLVVDDSRDVADFAGAALRRLGHEATVVYAGEAALAELADGAFEVLLTDYGMEGVSGLGLAREARERYPGIWLVLMTGWELSGPEAASFDAVLLKPFTIAQLRAALGALAAPEETSR